MNIAFHVNCLLSEWTNKESEVPYHRQKQISGDLSPENTRIKTYIFPIDMHFLKVWFVSFII